MHLLIYAFMFILGVMGFIVGFKETYINWILGIMIFLSINGTIGHLIIMSNRNKTEDE